MQKQQKPDPLVQVGIMLTNHALDQLIGGPADETANKALIQNAKELIDDAYSTGALQTDTLRFLAAREAIAALEEEATGKITNITIGSFDAIVENHQGGPTDVSLGGIPIKHKKTANENFLRAAVVVLWETYPQNRNQLAREAKQLLGLKNKTAIGKTVGNHNQRHDFDLERSRSPLSVHIPSVKRLMQGNNWTSLSDFAS